MGRKKEYSEDATLEKAMLCFWNNGYLNTSIRLLEKEMGINQFSIYSSFKNKENLYVLVLERYVKMMKVNYLKELSNSDSDIDDIQKFLEAFASSMVDRKVPGCCLMVSSMVYYEIFPKKTQQVIDRFSTFMESLFKKALKNSLANGMIRADISVPAEAKYLLGITQSLSTINKGMSKSGLNNYIKNSISKLK